MALLISLLGLIAVPLIAYFSLKGTLFDVSSPTRNPWPLIWYFDLATVLVPLVIISAVGINNISIIFMAEMGTEAETAAIVIVTLMIYVISLAFFIRLFDAKIKEIKNEKGFEYPNSKLTYALCIVGILLVVGFYFLGYKHAFLFSILKGQRLLEVRLSNKYTTHVPSQIQSVLLSLGYLLAGLSGYEGRTNLKKSFFGLAIAIFILSAPGNKALPVWALIIWILAQGSLIPKKLISFKSFMSLLFIICIVLTALYFIVSLQIPDLTVTNYGVYLSNRLGIGQMSGVYETLGLVKGGILPEEKYYWHMFPGARLFVDYVDFQKMLMMVTEGYNYEQMGVKNTYFIAEALAIGGFILMFLSPIIVAFSTVLGLIIFTKMLELIVGKKLCIPIAMLLYLKTHSITGGFAAFPFLKGVILIIGHLFFIWIICRLIIRLTWNKKRIIVSKD